MNSFIALVSCLVVAAAPTAKHPGKAGKPDFRQRTVKVTDDSGVPEVVVARGAVTTVTLPMDVDEEQLPKLIGARGREITSQVYGPSVFLTSSIDLLPNEVITMQVRLVDSTVVPFNLVSRPGIVDLKVDVELELTKKVTAESVQGLKGTVAELQARLDDCESTAAERGAETVAELILKQDFEKPEPFVVERHPIHSRDKQSRLLISAFAVYRLFKFSYVVLTVENRDPTKPWVMERAEVAMGGGGSTTDVQVAKVAPRLVSIPPAVKMTVVLAFSPPAREANQRFTLKLLEKAGQRHAELADLKL